MEATYRLYFWDPDGRIVGREDFGAPGDREAMAVAAVLCDACSDVCASFELWQGTRRLDTEARRRTSAEALDRVIQDEAARVEERLKDSRWLVAKSRRLLELTARGVKPGELA